MKLWKVCLTVFVVSAFADGILNKATEFSEHEIAGCKSKVAGITGYSYSKLYSISSPSKFIQVRYDNVSGNTFKFQCNNGQAEIYYEGAQRWGKL